VPVMLLLLRMYDATGERLKGHQLRAMVVTLVSSTTLSMLRINEIRVLLIHSWNGKIIEFIHFLLTLPSKYIENFINWRPFHR